MTSPNTQAALKAARVAVNAETFGTDAWEAAMVTVRALAEKANSERPAFVHTSIDGDVWSVR